MNYKIWFAICFLFLIFNLKQLSDDYNLINYMIVDKDRLYYQSNNKLLLCIPFFNIKEKDKSINNKIIGKNVSTAIFLNYSINSIEFNLKTSKLFKLNQSFILYNSVCFSINKKEQIGRAHV